MTFQPKLKSNNFAFLWRENPRSLHDTPKFYWRVATSDR
jgi:hypothetical protein